MPEHAPRSGDRPRNRYGPSDAAIRAAAAQCYADAKRPMSYGREGARVLRAAHDPALGLDRSVCLRDVVEALRWYGHPAPGHGEPNGIAAVYADFIEREFGGDDA